MRLFPSFASEWGRFLDRFPSFCANVAGFYGWILHLRVLEAPSVFQVSSPVGTGAGFTGRFGGLLVRRGAFVRLHKYRRRTPGNDNRTPKDFFPRRFFS